VRDDSGAYAGGDVPIYYDPLISKLITWGDSRPHALARMRRALAEYEVLGIKTTIPFFQWVLDDADFLAARFDTGFIDRKLAERNGQPLREPDANHEDLAAIAVAVSRVSKAAAVQQARPSRWNEHGRRAALR